MFALHTVVKEVNSEIVPNYYFLLSALVFLLLKDYLIHVICSRAVPGTAVPCRAVPCRDMFA